MIGFLIWNFTWKTSPFVLVWSIVFVVFSIVFFIAIFFSERVKIRNGRKIIHDKLARIHVGHTNNNQNPNET